MLLQVRSVGDQGGAIVPGGLSELDFALEEGGEAGGWGGLVDKCLAGHVAGKKFLVQGPRATGVVWAGKS